MVCESVSDHFIPIYLCLCLGDTAAGMNIPTKTPKGHSVTRICWHLHLPYFWCFYSRGITLHACYVKKRSLPPTNLCLWLRTFLYGSQWTFVLIWYLQPPLFPVRNRCLSKSKTAYLCPVPTCTMLFEPSESDFITHAVCLCTGIL